MIGAIQWIILTTVAMAYYPGGTALDPFATGFSFYYNYISDLGVTVVYSGVPNPVSHVMFVVAGIIHSCGLIAYFVGLFVIFHKSNKEKILGFLGTIFGLIGGGFLFALVFTPRNINFPLHLIVSQSMGVFLLIGLLFFTIVASSNKELPKKYTIIFPITMLIYLFIILVYLYIVVVLNPDPSSTEGVLIWVVGQKIVLYLFFGSEIIIAYGALKIIAH